MAISEFEIFKVEKLAKKFCADRNVNYPPEERISGTGTLQFQIPALEIYIADKKQVIRAESLIVIPKSFGYRLKININILKLG